MSNPQTKKKTTRMSKKIQPRKRVQPIWKNRWAQAGAAALLVGGGIAGGVSLWKSGLIEEASHDTYRSMIEMTAKAGFKVGEILVVGRDQSSKEDLLKALRIKRGSPILDFDPEDARARVENLDWVGSASVERLLPETVLLTVEERKPMALWQNKGRFYVIDEAGDVITDKGVERFADLFVVVGDGARENARELIAFMDSEPDLRVMVKAAVRVGKRRWNLHLNNDVDVRLPEENPADAWLRLAEYHRENGLLNKDVEVLDLRLADRLIIKTSGKKDKIQKVSDQKEGHRT